MQFVVTNKSELFKFAWKIFKANKDIAFSECLQNAWFQYKRYLNREAIKAAQQRKLAKFIADTENEEVKAWNWAEKKLGVALNLTDAEKERNVRNMYKEMWNANVWATAIKAVKLHMEIG
ncbi:hypothetical protein BU202_08290 [Streptococcus cuniculi]|uniref:Uncharacterized protein n=1 Tax=Streptococcus cuniculi TaxID=1432788 RepID=A0A1Q8E692_9STRE|nr:anti-CRISPR protein AcrIIA3 [Streptococcus cuniculi]OLF47316.1 hypothetical protein BU202_08290 [Streptococcus cuniculi]QBX23170.1 hypothetical protein Javan116_0041 [Streptococcus phage Javan116]